MKLASNFLSRRAWLSNLGGAALVAGVSSLQAVSASAASRWSRRSLLRVPRTYAAPSLGGERVQSVFLEGPAYRGRPTRVFALYGVPDRSQTRGKFPAMVLVHGGGGTAFADWIRLWTARGYAAIAMDTCGCVPVGTYGNWQRHEHGGPPGWGGVDQTDLPLTDQWMHQAVSAVVVAHSWLRDQPGVDPNRIGLTGISWGGVLTCITAAVDPRFRFAVPVYGCGFFGGDAVNGTLDQIFRGQSPEVVARWLDWWDPRWYLPEARQPFLWVNGTNDFAFPPPAWQGSYRLPSGPRALCLRVRMAHAHGGPGEKPEEIRAFADAQCLDGPPLPRVGRVRMERGRMTADCSARDPQMRAELNFTRARGRWQDRLWETVPAEFSGSQGKMSADVPTDATAAYLNLIDPQGRVVSAEHQVFG